MLFSRRQRLKELQIREAAGESFWTPRFSERVRFRLLYAFKDVCKPISPVTIQVGVRPGCGGGARGQAAAASGWLAGAGIHGWPVKA